MFRQIVRDAATEDLLSELGPAASDLSVIAAEPVPGSPGTGGRSTDRFLVFEAVTALLIDSARQCGTLVVLDDVHWADAVSIQLLAHLARGIDRSRLAVVATYRETEASSRPELLHTLADLAREPAVSRLRLVGLTSAEVARQLALVVGRPIDGATIDVVNRRTHGNPFFVAELGLLLEKRPDAAEELPDAVRVAVGHRLAGMPARVQRLVSIAAVLGERADSAALAELTGQALPAVLDDVDTRRAQGCSRARRGSPTTWLPRWLAANCPAAIDWSCMLEWPNTWAAVRTPSRGSPRSHITGWSRFQRGTRGGRSPGQSGPPNGRSSRWPGSKRSRFSSER